jgi:potassium efflux system protein
VLASRNLPGLLELAVLQRLPMDHGGRNAITTVSRYVLVLSGIVIACNTVGISWGNVQWLAAALTVGLGFGLQEIFANFISGLIILFERPVRIGDVITIDGVSGSVSRIQMRATTITDWDRKEYIVPNKEFVTGKVLNWTLSDKVNRVVVNVGVAYGTNTEAALQIMQSIADSHPNLLPDPPPVVSFEGFGDSCLNLVLRCYLPNLDHRLKVTTELHSTIHQRFSEAGIEIPFPQRDLHVRATAETLKALTASNTLGSANSTESVPITGAPRPDSKRAS